MHAFAETESGLLTHVEEPCAFGRECRGGDPFWHEEDSVRFWRDAFATDGFEERVDLVEVRFGGNNELQLVFSVAHPSGEGRGIDAG